MSLAGFEVSQTALAKGRAAWTFGGKERRDFAEFYADQAGRAAAASTTCSVWFARGP